MQSRVVGQRQSWRGLRRRVGRVTPGRLAVPGIVPNLSAGPSGLTDAEDDHDQANRVGGGGIVRAESGSGVAMTDVVDRAGGVGTPEQALVSMPERRVSLPEHSRVPGWLQTGAAWSWRLLLLAVALHLIARILGVLYIVVLPCIAALLLTAF